MSLSTRSPWKGTLLTLWTRFYIVKSIFLVKQRWWPYFFSSFFLGNCEARDASNGGEKNWTGTPLKIAKIAIRVESDTFKFFLTLGVGIRLESDTFKFFQPWKLRPPLKTVTDVLMSMRLKLKNVAKCFKMLQNVLKCCKMFWNVLKCFKMFQNVSKCFRMFQNVANCCKLLQFDVICCNTM